MTKITPYTALCELFRHKVDPNNDIENQATGTEQHGNVILPTNNTKTVPTINNSCQTQPLRDYSFDKVIDKAKTQKIRTKKTDIKTVNIALKDDNFQILRPDYAAYSGEKPYDESSPEKLGSNFKKIADKIQKVPKELCFTPLFNRNWMGRKTATIPNQKVNNQTSVICSDYVFQDKIIQPSFEKGQYIPFEKRVVQPYENERTQNLDVFPELNLYRRIPATKQNIHEFTQNPLAISSLMKPNPVKIHSSLKNTEVNALYRTVSDLKTTFQNKYRHCSDDNEEKCLCDHCGAFAVVNESLKRPVIYDQHQEDDESVCCKKHRRTIKNNNKHDEKEFIKLTMKLRMMEERIHELEEMNYIQGPIKIRNSALTFDMYTQCGKKNKKLRFSDPAEHSRSFSPKRLNPKNCPFSFTLPSNIKDRIFRRKSSEERKSEDGDSDDSDYKVNHISRPSKREKMPKPRLRCHDYMNKNKDSDVSPKKSFWKPIKTYTATVQCDEVPTKDIDVSAKDKQIHDLLLELNQQRKNLPAPTKTVRFSLDTKSNDTKVLYERKGYLTSSKSLLNKHTPDPTKTSDSEVLQYDGNTANNSENDYNYLFLKSPELIEKLVNIQPESKTYPSPNDGPKNVQVTTKQDLEKVEVKHENRFQSSNETSNGSSRKSRIKEQDEIFRVLRSMKLRNDFNNTSFPKVITNPLPKRHPKEIKTAIERPTLSQDITTTGSKSICQYINSNFSNKTSTSMDLNSSCCTVGNHKRSRSVSPVNKSSFDIDTKQPLKNDNRRKKMTITLPDSTDKRPTSAKKARKEPPPKNFIELNKHLDRYNRSHVREKYDFMSPSTHSQKKQEDIPSVSTQLVNNNINDCTGQDIEYFENAIKQETEAKNTIINNKKDMSNSKRKWTFSFLDLKSDIKLKSSQSKANKEKIIQELSRLSESKSNLSNQSIESTTIKNNDIAPNNISKTASKETVKKKSSIFSVIKRYSKQILPRRKFKLKSTVKFTIPPLKTKQRPIVESIKSTKLNNQNFSKIPVSCLDANKRRNSSPVHPNKEANSSNILNFFSGKKCDKFCLFKPDMLDKGTKLSNENISCNVVSSYTTPNIDNNNEINNHFEEIEKQDNLSVKTLLLNSIDSLFQNRNSNRNMSNIIIFNPTTCNGNLPIICEHTPNNVQRNNLSIQTTVLQNLMPSFFETDNSKQIILLPAKDNNINPHCSSCNKNKPNLNPPEPKKSTASMNKFIPSKPEKKNSTVSGKCSSIIRCKSSEKKMKEVNYLSYDEKSASKNVKIKDSTEKCDCKSGKICNKDKKQPNKNDTNIKEQKKVEAPKTDTKTGYFNTKTSKTCTCKTSPVNLPKSLGILSSLRKKKNKAPQPGKCIKCTKGNDKKYTPVLKPAAGSKTDYSSKGKAQASGKDSKILSTSSNDSKKKSSTGTVQGKQAPKKQVLLDPGEISKKSSKSINSISSKCSLKCSSHNLITSKTSKEKPTVATPAKKQSDMLSPGEIAKNKTTKPKGSKFSISSKCSLKCSPHNVTTSKTSKEKPTVATPAKKQSVMFSPGEQAKNKTTNPKDSKFSIKSSSNSVKTEEQFIQGDTLKLKKKTSPSKSPSTQSSVKELAFKKAKSLTKCLQDTCKCPPRTDLLLGPGEVARVMKNSNSLVTFKIPANNPSKCDWTLPGQQKPINQNDGSKKIKCKRCAPPPPVMTQMKKAESNCSCDLSNMNISFETPKRLNDANSDKCNNTCNGNMLPIDSSVSNKTSKSSSSFPQTALKKPSNTDVGKCNPERCSDPNVAGLFKEDKESVSKFPKEKTKEVAKKKVHIQQSTQVPSKTSNTSLKSNTWSSKANQTSFTKKKKTPPSSKTSVTLLTKRSKRRKTCFKSSKTSVTSLMKTLRSKSKSCLKKMKKTVSSSKSSLISLKKTVSSKISKTSLKKKKKTPLSCETSSTSLKKTSSSKRSQTNLKKSHPCPKTSKTSLKKTQPCPKSSKTSLKKAPCPKTSKTSQKKTQPCPKSSKTSLKKAPCPKTSKTSVKKTQPCPKSSKTSLKKTPCPKTSKTSQKKTQPCPKSSKTSLKKAPCSKSSNTSLNKTHPSPKRSKTSLKKAQCSKTCKNNLKKTPASPKRSQTSLQKAQCSKTCKSKSSLKKTPPSPKISQTSLKKTPLYCKSCKTVLQHSPSKHSKQEDPKKKKSETKVTSKSPSLSRKSSRSSCSVCTECKRMMSEHSLHHKSNERLTEKKKICNLRQMKNKITSKFSCKYFKSLYRHPIFAKASRCKCREMRMRIRNFCDVSRKDFDRVDSSEITRNNLVYCNTALNSSVVNIYYNMQRFSFEPASDEASYTEEDCHLTEDDKRDYLLEKLYLLQNFRNRIQDEGNTSNYGSFE